MKEYEKSSATTCNGTIMSDAVRMGVLEEINAIRTMLEKGILTDIDFNEYPKAEAMYKLVSSIYIYTPVSWMY